MRTNVESPPPRSWPGAMAMGDYNANFSIVGRVVLLHPPLQLRLLPLQLQLWILIRQRDATRKAAVKLCQGQGERVPRDLLPSAPPPVAACGEVTMTRGERARALGSMMRAIVMRELAHGADMLRALGAADAQKRNMQKNVESPPPRSWPGAMAAMMKRVAAAHAPPFHLCHALPFSVGTGAPLVILSPDRLTATQTNDYGPGGAHISIPRTLEDGARRQLAWARSESGVDAACGVVRWAMQFSQESYLSVCVGVAAEAFRELTADLSPRSGGPRQVWFFDFSDDCVFADGQKQGRFITQHMLFAAGDVVTVELQRARGVDGMLRLLMAGEAPQELRGLPRDGVLYPIVGLGYEESVTMIALP
jgi:hypothetical protein